MIAGDLLLARFARLAADNAADEVQAALLVNRLLSPSLDETVVRRALHALIPASGESPWSLLARLGWKVGDRAILDLDNSRLDYLLANGRGIPITLALVLVDVARRAGVQAWGLNAPGHFLARVDRAVIDPAVMQPLPLVVDYGRATTVDIGMRMLNNVKHGALSQAAPHMALAALDCQLAMAETLGEGGLCATLHMEAAECWASLQAKEEAKEAFERCLSFAEPGSRLAQVATLRLKAVANRQGPTLH
ncbi:MAG: hypothetical protein H6993_01880 [Pseudomonadales bacterium]|nr:hypothetical protein [Pseudomonadales bacterium]